MFASIAILFVMPWLDTSKVRSAVYRPMYKVAFWVFAANALFLGWLGAKPAEGIYTPLSQISTAYYFGFFLIILPLLGIIEKPRRTPTSITEAVLAKATKVSGGASAQPVGAAAAPDKKA
ncbi:MAG: cytochrome b, partial [Pseudomonadota bacterium]